ncbi:MerR HTH family regulatory protein [Micromonospora phaseoli]|uniref:MerR HTH family regulatory protein n=1 Tax=Micromonospora phaseoli TaxID=1144548 RepID=A0A1H7C7H3_9ACTN|nr:MerR family transcriptional regulator [Micromonospora phaseoli]PZV92803.1 MerR-like DNA binding protein [Micromonospora phaseoli]GIJ76541.1 MerR family transcriptional regulator [Micromonospora phaseoli]SEJ81565.1 MerR HTH family regulatory protein [Micromonospora phaseoli]
MRIGELSHRAELPIPTIKFYLREGLLPPGRSVREGRQLYYDERHLSRLALIRTLTVLGGMSLASVRTVVRALDDGGTRTADLSAVINDAMATEDTGVPAVVGNRDVAARVDALVDHLGWRVDPDSPGRHTLARVLAALEQHAGVEVGALMPYAAMAMSLSTMEAAGLPPRLESEADAVAVVAQIVLLDAALLALRRLAREHLGQAGGSGRGERP